jgi:hypothetical protein
MTLQQYKTMVAPGFSSEWSPIYRKRHRTMLYDKCWFSNKPHIIVLTVEECIKKHPDYMRWIYKNLKINWSMHVIAQLNTL